MLPTEDTRVRLDFGYDGTDFAGWAKQPDLRTVQGELEAAAHKLFGFRGDFLPIIVAGRTDAGVHASHQVAHLDISPERFAKLAKLKGPDGKPSDDIARHLRRRINGVLGAEADIVVHSSRVVPPEFDARFSALSRSYRYRIADPTSLKDPIVRRTTLWYTEKLDLDVLDETARNLVGLHDFGAYCRPRPGATTIRHLTDFRWRRDEDGLFIAELKADAFCHSMVRSLVGACLAVNQGRMTLAEAVRLLEQTDRGLDYAVAPAHGLTLVGINYPEDELLAARAELTRQRRLDTTPFDGE